MKVYGIIHIPDIYDNGAWLMAAKGSSYNLPGKNKVDIRAVKHNTGVKNQLRRGIKRIARQSAKREIKQEIINF